MTADKKRIVLESDGRELRLTLEEAELLLADVRAGAVPLADPERIERVLAALIAKVKQDPS